MAALWNPYSTTITSVPRTPSRRTPSASTEGRSAARRTSSPSAWETRVSLVVALASQASAVSRRVLLELAEETTKYAFPRRISEARNLEEALMAVPDLETVKFRVLKRTDEYEIREVEPYYIAETTMPAKTGFDFNGSSQAFNVLAEYLFGKNTSNKQMEMTTPVYTSKSQSTGEKMEMTTPVITKQSADRDNWQMSFVLPSKYGSDLPVPNDPSVTIKEVPRKIVAVTAFSGFVTDEDVRWRESKLRDVLRSESDFKVKEGALVEVAQFNPPFALPFTRRNEVALEVERKT